MRDADQTDSAVHAQPEPELEPLKSIYFLSGIGTWRSGDLFGGAMKDIAARYASVGIAPVHVRDIYPYGWMDDVPLKQFYRFLARQALRVSHDMYVRYTRNRGGHRAFREIRKDYEEAGGGPIVLIGHSGGGVAAYKTAKLLTDRGYTVEAVIHIGTPTHSIADDWQDRVWTLRKAGRIGDGITWWGRPCIGAPRQSAVVAIRGGHTDYFRTDRTDAEGRSNLTLVMDKVWGWLKPR
ncbi:thioesterase domain-containing protein [Gorillibacterium sp. CAU 1737]|uniref:thioesterase domain-containing protein n=1 Tax=Gorillibacterium sp. CAU 1737 TaxID=3140362 RepID=UPI00326018E9